MKIINRKIVISTISAFLISVSFFSCSTLPKDIDEDLTASQLIQRGQDAAAIKKYRAAEAYYSKVIERFGTDQKRYVEAKYEIANMNRKRKKYTPAYNGFQEIITIYENAPYGMLPPAYRKLAEIELAKIPESAVKQAEKDNEAARIKAEEEAIKQAELEAAQAELEAKKVREAEAAQEAPESDEGTAPAENTDSMEETEGPAGSPAKSDQ